MGYKIQDGAVQVSQNLKTFHTELLFPWLTEWIGEIVHLDSFLPKMSSLSHPLLFHMSSLPLLKNRQNSTVTWPRSATDYVCVQTAPPIIEVLDP